MAINKIPEMVTDAKVYEEGADNMIGVANIDMPEFSNMTTSIKGVGLAGEIDAPVKGHFQSLEMKINWRTPHTTALLMSGGKPVKLEIWANIQNMDSGANEYDDDCLRIVAHGRAKSYATGTLETGNTSDSSNTIELHYIKVEYEGVPIVEIDKYNYKCIVDGVDLLARVRRNIGMR